MRPPPTRQPRFSMETSRQTIERLLGALETLTREEHQLLDNGSVEVALEIQEREQPLVARIAELLLEPGLAASLPPAICDRVHSLLNAQQLQLKKLSARMAAQREELTVLDSARRRVRLLRPSYGRPDTASASFVGEA